MEWRPNNGTEQITVLEVSNDLDWRGRVTVSTEEGLKQSPATGWVYSYAESYHYSRTWVMLIFPIFGLMGVYFAIQSSLAVVVAMGTEVLLFLVFLEWKTYRIRVSAGSISRSSFLHHKSFALSEVDLIQHVYGGRGAQFIYIRRGDRVLLKIFGDLVEFDDILGFLREYAKHRHLIFAIRDPFGVWTQAGNSNASDTI